MTSGWVRLLVQLGGTVTKGALIAELADAFGRVTETIAAPATGQISTIAADPRAERGSMIARIIYVSDDPECAMGC